MDLRSKYCRIALLKCTLFALALFVILSHFRVYSKCATKINDLYFVSQRDSVLAALNEANPGWNGVICQQSFSLNGYSECAIRAEFSQLLPYTKGNASIAYKGSECLSDLSPLRSVKLVGLFLYDTRRINPSSLNDVKPERLNLTHTNISDLSWIKNMHLTDLNLGFNPITDLSPLKGMQLGSLNIAYTGVEDLSPLKQTPLKSLSMNGCKVTDLSPIAEMKLESLDISNCDIADLSPLKGMPLYFLNFQNTPAAKLPLPNWLPKNCQVVGDMGTSN